MTDWKTLARAAGLDLPDDELTRTLAPLESLEQAFLPLAAQATSDLDLAVVFDPSAAEADV